MLSSLLTTALAFIGLATAGPFLMPHFKSAGGVAIHLTDIKTGDCNALIEETPWSITRLVTFKAKAHPHSVSYFIFDFEDVNKGLQTKTQCQHYLRAGSNASIADEEYYGCVDRDVQFQWNGKELLVERWYQDAWSVLG